MRRNLSSALIFLVGATFGLAAETPSPSSKTTPRTAEPSSSSQSSKDASKEASKTRKISKEKPSQSPGEKAGKTEDERFTVARKAAYEDSRVSELRAKVDSSKSDETANKAMRSYLKALYGKMRSIEPPLEERINMTEAAALRAIPQ
ncbi:MAG: hypothetical protein DVB28_000752 [Verrucomicrobia bacterium]|nr:MAG: hypothetical protein DVB28_000752 [Verrucomicrobiota bacterium]